MTEFIRQDEQDVSGFYKMYPVNLETSCKPCLTSAAEPIDRRRFVSRALLQRCRREGGLVRWVGVVLGLETKPGSSRIEFSSFARQRTIKKVSRIKLHARFGGPHLHDATTRRFIRRSRESHHTRRAIDHPRVIVATTKFYLFIILIDTLANRVRRKK